TGVEGKAERLTWHKAWTAVSSGFSISYTSRKKIDVIDLGSAVAPIQISDVEALEQVSREDYTLPIFVPEGQKWVLPGGAFGREACGSD
ncbi:hypothetical protein ODT35_20965, partial [Escherichia coli]|nr:hypothetical protein [Escherichia coli]